MEQHGIERVQPLEVELRQQGKHSALTGLLEQAATILTQVWDIAQDLDPDSADATAWKAGWLCIHMKRYDDAAGWFGHVSACPAKKSHNWEATRQVLVQLCLELAHASRGPSLAANRAYTEAARPLHAQPPSMLPHLRVIHMGRFQIFQAETMLPTCTAYKAIAIFRYLMSRRHRAARKEELLELLWPNSPPRAATRSLHVAITTLRRYLDPPIGSYVLFEAGQYTINPDAQIEDDRRYFEQCCDEAERYSQANDLIRAHQFYRDAITCYQGDYYVGEQDFAWAIGEQERLLARYLSALDHLGRILIARRHFESAIEYYRRLLERDSYREDAHCQLMRCYWQLGRRSEALLQYERCASILVNDLGLEPMTETRQLYYTISKQGDVL
jgi:DNA-binding SARP family transcriptional activator